MGQLTFVHILITKYEDSYKRLNLATGRTPGIVPICDRQGNRAAYAVHGKIVRLLAYMGSRMHSCTSCSANSCLHVAAAKEYENVHGNNFNCRTEGVLEANVDDDDDKHKYLEAKNSA